MRVIVCEKVGNLGQAVCREFLFPDGNPDEWRGVTVFDEFSDGARVKSEHMGAGTLCREAVAGVPFSVDGNQGRNCCSDGRTLDPLTPGLLAKARNMADETGDKAQILLIGEGLVETARKYFCFVDRVFVYDDPGLAAFHPEHYIDVFWHFIENYKPAALFIRNSESMRPLIDAVLTKTGDYLGCTSEVSEFTLSCSNPVCDPDHRGELVICEIPDAILGINE